MPFQQAAAVVSINTLQTGASHLIIAKLVWGGQFTSRKSTQKIFYPFGADSDQLQPGFIELQQQKCNYQDAAEDGNTRPVSLWK